MQRTEGAEEGEPLKEQLDIFRYYLDDDYQTILKTAPSSQKSGEEYTLTVSLPHLSRKPTLAIRQPSGGAAPDAEEKKEEILTTLVTYTEASRVADVIERAVTKQHYLTCSDESLYMLAHLSEFCLFIGDDSVQDHCYYSGRCLMDDQLTMAQHNLKGDYAVTIDMIPWNINLNLSNVVEPGSNKPAFCSILVNPSDPISVAAERLAAEYCVEKSPDTLSLVEIGRAHV